MGPHLPVIYSITRGRRPKSILEIGIRGGASTRAFDEAICDGDFKCVHYCCDINPRCHRVIDALKAGGVFYGDDSNNVAEHWDNVPIDILFIDGCHEYSQVHNDFIHFYPDVTVNGIIFFHDLFPPENKKDDPQYSWSAYKIVDDLNELVNGGRIEMVTLPYCNGLTICRKLED